MRRDQLLQSIFLSLVLVGLFAMMAQNGYGFTVLGIACFGLAVLYVAEAIWGVLSDISIVDKKTIVGLSESVVLSFLLLLFGLRAFYIRLPYVDYIFIVVCGLLMLVYGIIALEVFTPARRESPQFAWNVISFYSSILLFLLSLGARIISPSLSVIIGAIGTVAAIPVFISVVRQRQYDYLGKPTTLFQFLAESKNKAGILFLFFIFSGIYVGLSNFSIIPAIENADKPRTYIDMINNAERGIEKPVDGKYQHEVYKEAMDKFLERHAGK